jgi:hypothetical protein
MTFLLFSKKSQVIETLNWLNSQHQKIQFSMEEEQSFLDVMVKRRENQLIIDVYRKTTSTNRYVTADSFSDKKTNIPSQTA